ncbi:MAG: hypothetical protein JWO58_2531 [Chitinophagaceae bacterium]|nr:hypothetical protein [Chitinophagaceae bacterium]
MRTGLKIILIISTIFFSVFLIAIIDMATEKGSGSGAFKIILVGIMIAVSRAIWKYNPNIGNNLNTADDKHRLNKK